MDQQYDPRNVLSAMHHKVTGELLKLMDGFYSNIEDGLFELAYRDPSQHKRCFNLMREMRFQRAQLVQAFANRMQKGLKRWYGEMSLVPQDVEADFERLAGRMASKCATHFSHLLTTIAERTTHALGREIRAEELPISPYQVSYAFLVSCRSLEFDKPSIEIVQELFSRFVLDRLGSVYGECNRRLEDAGYLTEHEEQMLAASTA